MRKNNAGFIQIILTLVVIGLVGGGIYYFGKTSNKSNVIIVTPTEEPIVDPTANWKTYTNSEYGFEINYPSDIKINENSTNHTKTIGFRSDYLTPDESYLGFVIVVNTVGNNTNLISWINSYVIQKLPNGTSGSIMQGEVKQYKNSNINGYYFLGGRETLGKYIVFKDENLIYEVVLTGKDTGGRYLDNPDAEKRLDQILSTFKFNE